MCTLTLPIDYRQLLSTDNNSAIKGNNLVFFLNDACQIANLPKLLMTVKDCCPNIYKCIFLSFLNVIFQLLMYKYIHKMIYHTQTPKIT